MVYILKERENGWYVFVPAMCYKVNSLQSWAYAHHGTPFIIKNMFRGMYSLPAQEKLEIKLWLDYRSVMHGGFIRGDNTKFRCVLWVDRSLHFYRASGGCSSSSLQNTQKCQQSNKALVVNGEHLNVLEKTSCWWSVFHSKLNDCVLMREVCMEYWWVYKAPPPFPPFSV